MTSLAYGEVFLRLAVAVGAGALIGLDRELRRKPAGLRTLALVSLGSALFVLETIDSLASHPDATSRVIQGVVTGVGFLGAGSIARAAVALGAGRDTVGAPIEPAAGIRIVSNVGAHVSQGDVVLELLFNDPSRQEIAVQLASQAVRIEDAAPPTTSLELAVVGSRPARHE